MKKLMLTVTMAMLVANLLLAADEVKEVRAGVKGVTVFPDRAQLFYETDVNIGAGRSTIKLTGLSPYIDQNSIQVKGTGSFTILSVTPQNNYLEDLEGEPYILELKKRLEELELKIEDEKTGIAVLKEKEAFLVANRAVMGGNSTFSIEQFKSMMALYTTNIEQIAGAVTEKNRIVKGYEEEAASLKAQIEAGKSKDNLPMGEIVLTVSADKAVAAKLAYSYVVFNAGWYPSYDIRVEDINKPVEVVYKANIFQTTGVEWSNVLISLSNATPWVSGSVPTLYPWFVDFYQQLPVMRASAAKSMPSVAAEESAFMVYDMVEEEANTAAGYVSRREGETTVNFDLSVPYSVSSDGKAAILEIQVTELESIYKYVSVPKLSGRAYLTGEVAKWGENGFQSGEATLYFENSYVGTSYIDAGSTADTLALSLGVDNSIVVTREKQTDFTSRRTIGSNKTETYSYKITVRNNKQVSIKIDIFDQIPISSNSEISVEALELSGGKVDTATGEVKWELEIAPQQAKELVFTYSMRYPKNRNVYPQ